MDWNTVNCNSGIIYCFVFFRLRKGFKYYLCQIYTDDSKIFLSGLDFLWCSSLVCPPAPLTYLLYSYFICILWLHMFQQELLIFLTATTMPLTAFRTAGSDNFILSVAQVRSVGVILNFPFSLTLTLSGFRMHTESDHFFPRCSTTRFWGSHISCLDLLEESLSDLSASIFASLQSILNIAARLIL